MSDSQRFLAVLLAAYLVLAVWLAIAPYDRLTWLIENATIWILVAIIVSLWRGGIVFSRTAYALMFILIYLHTIGGHYTFALVPFGWVTETFGFARNHFDRLAHVSVGFYAYAIAELLWTRRLVNHRWLLFSYPVFAIATEAIKRKTGARGLRAIVEELMLDVMYELPGKSGVRECVVSEEVVARTKEPILVYEKEAI